MLTSKIFITFLIAYLANGKLLLWSKQKLRLPALKHYTAQTLRDIVDDAKIPAVAVYESKFSDVPIGLLRNRLGLNSAYLPSADYIDFEELRPTERLEDLTTIEDLYERYGDALLVLQQGGDARATREEELASAGSNSTPTATTSGILFEDAHMMLYTKRAPLLRRRDMFLELAQCESVSAKVDTNKVTMSLAFTVPDNISIKIDFMMLYQNMYWTLMPLKISLDDLKERAAIELSDSESFVTGDHRMSIPDNMSYHCTNDMKWNDAQATLELTLFGIQIAPYCEKKQFPVAVECLTYMNPATLTILFIWTIFIVGVLIGMVALGSIRTNDRFDTARTKLLHLEDIGEK